VIQKNKKKRWERPQRSLFMKKGKLLTIGLAILLMTIGMVLSSCSNCSHGGDCHGGWGARRGIDNCGSSSCRMIRDGLPCRC